MFRINYGNQFCDYVTSWDAFNSHYLVNVIQKTSDFVDAFCDMLDSGEVLYYKDPITEAEIRVCKI
jgi:hypothetical protein